MKTVICKVIAQTDVVYVQSKKSENGQMAKSYLRLREPGGDEYQCTLLGDIALHKFEPGKLVVACLRFSTHENNGGWYQDIIANEINPIN